MHKLIKIITGTLTVALALGAATTAQARIIDVTTTSDLLSGIKSCSSSKDICSLRDAVILSNRTLGADTIRFAVNGTFILTRTFGASDASYGDLDITDNTIIIGNGTGTTFIDGNATDRVFETASGSNLVLRNLTVQNGAADYGAGIYTAGNLTLSNVVINDSTAQTSGGGVYVAGTSVASFINSTISNNTTVTMNGGGVYLEPGTTGTFTSASITANLADGWGGGVFSEGTVTMNGSTVSGNTGWAGAGIYTDTQFTADALTVADNISDHYYGTGLLIDGEANITNSTVQNNTGGTYGSGIFMRGNAVVTLDNLLIDGNEGWKGGGIYTQTSDLTMSNITLSNNTAEYGGGLYVYEGESISASALTVTNNSASSYGGGIYVEGDRSSRASLQLSDSTITNNTADDRAGGVYVQGEFTSTNVTIDSNTAAEGGGLYVTQLYNYPAYAALEATTVSNNTASIDGGGVYIDDGEIYVLNSTIGENSAEHSGGAMYFDNSSTYGLGEIVFSTIANNTADPSNLSTTSNAGGIYNDNAELYTLNSIIANNTNAQSSDCSGALTSRGYTILETTTGCTYTSSTGDRQVDPALDVLANYGGSTSTYQLQPSSPAIDQLVEADCVDMTGARVTEDQRGVVRNAAVDSCDIGAFEL